MEAATRWDRLHARSHYNQWWLSVLSSSSGFKTRRQGEKHHGAGVDGMVSSQEHRGSALIVRLSHEAIHEH